ncbi:MAG: hypothetical protein QOG30_3443, partial [Acidimicrobiaceae bacterium]
YRDSEGAEHLHVVGTRATMARIDQALKPIVDDVFKRARTDGVREPLDAYQYDALVELADRSLCDGAGRSTRPRKPTIRNLVVLRIDLEALTRGRPETGETCEIAGLGPISVETAREMLGESIVKLVITKGVDVLNVTHLGRGPNIAQKIALLWQQPVCIREGCNNTARVEYNHAYGVEYARRSTLVSTRPTRRATGITISLRTRVGPWSRGPGSGRWFLPTIRATRRTGRSHEGGGLVAR